MSFVRSSVVRNNFSTNKLSLTIFVLTMLFIHGSLGQDILFPGQRPPVTQRVGMKTTTTTTTMKTTTTNASSPSACPLNMTLIYEANDTKGFCECTIGNLYNSKFDRCYLQYTRGPCNEGEIFILQKNETEAKCVRNPCNKRNTVSYKGSCYGLYLPGGPCKSNETLTIPEDSYEPKCVEIVPVHYQIINAPRKTCAPGTRMASFGKCRPILP